MAKRIIIIDDEPSICSSLTLALEGEYLVDSATDAGQGLSLIAEKGCDLCLLDLRIGNDNGIDVLEKIKALDRTISVIMMTAFGSIESSVKAMRQGAYSYLTKPLDLSELTMVIERALEVKDLHVQVEYLSNELENKYLNNGMIGNSSAMRQVYTLIEKLSDVDANVMITGESGTGKELTARAIHFSGARKKGLFVAINCAAIPENLLEEELFGHKRGAFTGAVSDKKGKFEIANNGTIFLDEIGDLPLSLQAKLLRVLQQKEFCPIGSNETVKTDARVITATNRDLNKMVKEGSFRQDLLFRLCVVEIHLPSLRERREDLPLLFSHFIAENNKKMSKQIRGLSEDTIRILMNYSYPGNIRELSNIIEHAAIFADHDLIEPDDLPMAIRAAGPAADADMPENADVDSFILHNLAGLTLKEVEQKIIKATLLKNNGRKNATAEMLGISERGLRNKILEYGLQSFEDEIPQ